MDAVAGTGRDAYVVAWSGMQTWSVGWDMGGGATSKHDILSRHLGASPSNEKSIHDPSHIVLPLPVGRAMHWMPTHDVCLAHVKSDSN